MRALCEQQRNSTVCGAAADGVCAWNGGVCMLAADLNEQEEAPAGRGLDWVAIAATNIAILGVVVALCALAFVHAYRSRPVMLLSQVLFLKLLCIGAVLANTSIFPHAFEPDADWLCVLRKWWFDLAATLCLGALALKLFRVWRVFYGGAANNNESGGGFSDRSMLRGVGALLAFDALLLILWTVVEPPRAVYEADRNAYRCKSEGAGLAFLWLTRVFMGLLALAALALAWRVRGLGSVLGETKQLLFILNNALVFALFNLVILVAEPSGVAAETLVFAFSVFWCCSVGLFVLLLSKYEKLDMTHEEIVRAAADKGGLGGTAHSGQGGSGSNGTPASAGAASPSSREATAFAAKAELLSGSSRRLSLQQKQEQEREWEQQRRHSGSWRDVLNGSGARTVQAPHVAVEGPSWPQNAPRAVTAEAAPLPASHWREAPAATSFRRNSTAGASDTTTPATMQSTDDAARPPLPPRPDAPSATSPAAASPAAAAATAANAAATSFRSSVSDGFKIGEMGAWEEYVHRETGESFWVSKETGEIKQDQPDQLEMT